MSADLDFGKLAFKFQGNFELDKKYEKLDCVYYDFSTYLAINTPNIGEEPSSSSAWVLMCQGYGLASEQEVADGVVDNKAVTPASLKTNKTTRADVFSATKDKIITAEHSMFLGLTKRLALITTASNGGAYARTGTWSAPDLFSGKPYPIKVIVKGGGASGSKGTRETAGNIFSCGLGGGEGGTMIKTLLVNAGQTYNYIIGAGGDHAVSANYFSFGAGGSSSFGTITALGAVHYQGAAGDIPGGSTGANRGLIGNIPANQLVFLPSQAGAGYGLWGGGGSGNTIQFTGAEYIYIDATSGRDGYIEILAPITTL